MWLYIETFNRENDLHLVVKKKLGVIDIMENRHQMFYL